MKKKEDWKKIRDDAKRLVKETMINAAVFRSTMMMAENMLKKYKKEEKPDEEGKE